MSSWLASCCDCAVSSVLSGPGHIQAVAAVIWQAKETGTNSSVKELFPETLFRFDRKCKIFTQSNSVRAREHASMILLSALIMRKNLIERKKCFLQICLSVVVVVINNWFWLKLLEAWLALTSVNYHRNALVSILLNQWLTLIMLRATDLWPLAVHLSS